MKTNKLMALVASAAMLQLAVNVCPVCAGILSNLDLDQEVYEDNPGNGTGHASQVEVVGTTIPFQQSAKVNDQSGGLVATATANYSVTDNGSVATFDISCSGFIDPAGYGVEEHSASGEPIFDLTQPCRYTATFNCTGPSTFWNVTPELHF